jgi:hypothetical protein
MIHALLGTRAADSELLVQVVFATETSRTEFMSESPFLSPYTTALMVAC